MKQTLIHRLVKAKLAQGDRYGLECFSHCG